MLIIWPGNGESKYYPIKFQDKSGYLEFEEFCQLSAKFLVEEGDEEDLKKELKNAFRIYDKEGEI